MAMRKFYSEIRGLKVSEVPQHVKPMLSIDFAKNAIKKGLDNYHANVATSSISSTPRNMAVATDCPTLPSFLLYPQLH
ncbi:hypothetical protein Vadar_010770 [Vaccinium darrowii]|uniref:Uncharacterized protein n=1 Tax=Vaccinium darrowii TaxID=229202 RepID=A0ACB7ZJQ8_9ERIC|nr:hypothetical protein Vadar_010770 [Vaccinium darrowii]